MNILKKQNGNALFFILIAIALLGLLTVTMTRSGSSTNDTGDYEQSQIAASQLLSYAKSIENAVQTLLARGCSENEISFENATVAGYINPNSPADKSCHVFDVAGAGMTYEIPNDRWLDRTKDSEDSYQVWVFSGQQKIGNIGIAERCGGFECADLIIYISYLNNDMCAALNTALKQDVSIEIADSEGISALDPEPADYFKGTYDNSQGYVGNDNADLLGKETACMYRSFRTNYAFYHVLHAR